MFTEAIDAEDLPIFGVIEFLQTCDAVELEYIFAGLHTHRIELVNDFSSYELVDRELRSNQNYGN